MKNIKTLLIFIFAISFCFILGACSLFNNTLFIDNWKFKPAQASGQELDLSVFSANNLSFNFSVENRYDARTLNIETFLVSVIVNEENINVDTKFLDEYGVTSVSFNKNETRNIVLIAISTINIEDASKVIIKYDGKTICEYRLK